jgi:hypothetical protein
VSEDLAVELTPAAVHEHGASLVAGAIDRAVADSLAAYERYRLRLELARASAAAAAGMSTVHECTVTRVAGEASTCVNPLK